MSDDSNETSVDMSPDAIDRRLRELSDLLEFCLKLRRDVVMPEGEPPGS
jgi:hypothetical protein